MRKALPTFYMEQQFNCSKDALKKARVTFWFYATGILVVVALFLLSYLLIGPGRIEWTAIIYVLIVLLFAYLGYRAYCVLRAIRQSFCRINGETVSGISTPDPYQKGSAFQISKEEIIMIEDGIVPAERKDDIPHGRSLHQPPSTSAAAYGYRSTVIRTKDTAFTLLAIEPTDELKTALESE